MSSATNEKLSESVDWKLAEVLFRQRRTLIIGGAVPQVVAAVGFFRTGHTWFIYWGIVALIVLAARLVADWAFGRPRDRAQRPGVWRLLFLLGSSANAAVYGVGAAYSVLATDALMQMLVITMKTAYVMGSAARNSAFPRAAVASVLLAEAPLMLACLATRQTFYVFYAVFAAFFAVAALQVTRDLYTQTVRFLVTDEQNASLVSEVRRSNIKLAAANDKLAEMASTDQLTGVPNRRSFDALLAKEAATARRDRSEVSLLMFDVDWFKEYNDRNGHQAGDACLRQMAQALAAHLRRPRDLLARYGGEEFVAILPQTSSTAAVEIAELLRARVEALGLPHCASTIGVVTVSVGVSTLAGDGVETPEAALRRADEALYIAKEQGRNRVAAAPSDRHTSRRASGTAEKLTLT